jgi:hypothetical protein
MSFDRLSSLESQPTTTRRQDDAYYRDDPEFSRLAESLSTRLFELTANISRLSNQIALLGTKRDTERVRERVHDLLEETRDGFKEVGEGIKKITSWEDINVSILLIQPFCWTICNLWLAATKIHVAEIVPRVWRSALRIPSHSTTRSRKGSSI